MGHVTGWYEPLLIAYCIAGGWLAIWWPPQFAPRLEQAHNALRGLSIIVLMAGAYLIFV